MSGPAGDVQHVLDGGDLLHWNPWPWEYATYQDICGLYSSKGRLVWSVANKMARIISGDLNRPNRIEDFGGCDITGFIFRLWRHDGLVCKMRLPYSHRSREVWVTRVTNVTRSGACTGQKVKGQSKPHVMYRCQSNCFNIKLKIFTLLCPAFVTVNVMQMCVISWSRQSCTVNKRKRILGKRQIQLISAKKRKRVIYWSILCCQFIDHDRLALCFANKLIQCNVEWNHDFCFQDEALLHCCKM